MLGSFTAFFSTFAAASVLAICEEIIAGSTGAPATVGFPLGGRLAGG